MSPADYASQLAYLRTLTIGEDFDDAFFALFSNADHDQRLDLCACYRAGTLKRIERYRNPEPLPRSEVQTLPQLQFKTLFLVMGRASADPRDALWSLAWNYHTAELLGTDPRQFLLDLEPFASESMARAIRDLIRRENISVNDWSFGIVQGLRGPYIDVVNRPLSRARVSSHTPQTSFWTRDISAWLFGHR